MYQQQKVLLFSAAFYFLFSCHKKNDSPALAALSITSISPTVGGKNTVLTITGSNFSTVTKENEVFINGAAAVVTAATPTSLTVTVPARAGTGAVTIKKGNQSASGPTFNYSFNYYQVTTVAGSTQGIANGKGTLAQFNNPWGLAVDLKGNIFVADTYNHRIREIYPDGTVTIIAGTGQAGYINGQADLTQFNRPLDIAVDKTGILYVADAGNHAIRKLTPGGSSGYTVSTLAGANTPGNPGFLDATGTNARFNLPGGISIDTIGNLYVTELGNNRIRKIVLQNTAVTTMAGSATPGYKDGPSGTALFNQPSGPAADPAGKYVFIADAGNNNIRQVLYLSDGSLFVNTRAGSLSGTGGFQDDDFLKAQFTTPTDIAVDIPRGIEIIADYGNNCIRIMDLLTNKVRTLAGSKDHPGSDDGPVATATFNLPSGITVDAAGNIYIAEYGSSRIRRIACE